MKKIWNDFSGNRPLFLLALLVSLLYALNSILLPTVSGGLVNRVMAASALSFSLFAVFLAVSCAQVLLSVLNQYVARRLVLRQKQVLRRRAFTDFSRRRDCGREERAAFVSFVNNDIVSLAEQYFLGSVDIVQCVSLLVFSAVSLLRVHWLMALIILGIGALIMVVPGLLRRRGRAARESYSRQMARYNGVLQSFLGGLPVLRAYCCRERAEALLEEESRGAVKAEAGVLCWSLTTYGVSAVLQVLKDALILGVGILLVHRGGMTMGGLVAALQISAMIGAPIEVLAYLLHSRNEVLPLLDKLADFAPKSAGEPEPEPWQEPFAALSVCRVSCWAGETGILNEVSAVFQAGGKYLITGESGSGKSTLLRLMARLGELDATGEIRLNRRAADAISPADFYRMICPVFQEPYLFHATLRENILLGREIPEPEYRALVEALNLGYLLERYGGRELTPERIERLSGGERQRVALARAMVGKPAVYLLDEVTSALDPANAERIEGLLLDTEAAVVHVCHKPNPALLSRYDACYVMRGGRLMPASAGQPEPERETCQNLYQNCEKSI